MWGITLAELVNCELTKALEHAGDFVRLAEESRDDEAALMAHTAALIANFFIGDLEQAHELAVLISARYNPRVHRKLVQVYQHDPLILALVYSGHIARLFGRRPPGPDVLEATRRLLENDR